MPGCRCLYPIHTTLWVCAGVPYPTYNPSYGCVPVFRILHTSRAMGVYQCFVSYIHPVLWVCASVPYPTYIPSYRCVPVFRNPTYIPCYGCVPVFRILQTSLAMGVCQCSASYIHPVLWVCASVPYPSYIPSYGCVPVFCILPTSPWVCAHVPYHTYIPRVYAWVLFPTYIPMDVFWCSVSYIHPYGCGPVFSVQ